MSRWIEPIIDRSQSDITNRTSKAYLNAADWNRIEGNIVYLSETLYSLGYEIQPMPVIDWDRDGIPTKWDIQRICDNIATIMAFYYEPRGHVKISDLPGKTLDFNDVNHLEKNLLGIKELLDRGIHFYNKWGDLKQFTYEQLGAYSYEQLKKGLDFPNFLEWRI